jgi:hypothetical protein
MTMETAKEIQKGMVQEKMKKTVMAKEIQKEKGKGIYTALV